jgi:hypothetical protein
MYLIDETFFIGKYAIAGLEDTDATASTELEYLIDEKGRLLLQKAFGNNVLYDDFNTYIEADGTLDPLAPQKWKDLVDGVTYTKDDVEYRWRGLTFTEGTWKGSLMTQFVYCSWIEQNVSYLSGVGEVQAAAKNAPAVNSTQRYVTVWNGFVKMYQGGVYNGRFGWHDFGNWQYGYHWSQYNYWNPCDDGTVSLLKFLYDNPEAYPDVKAKVYDVKNQIGL